MLAVRVAALITVAAMRLEQFYKVLLAVLVAVVSLAVVVAVLHQSVETFQAITAV